MSAPRPLNTGTESAAQECKPEEYAFNHVSREFYVRCAVHREDEAAVRNIADFRCTQGNGWMFLVRETPLRLSALLSLTELRLRLRSRSEAALAHDDDYTFDVGLLKADGPLALVPLTVARVPGTGKWYQDEHDYSVRVPEYVVTDADGVEYLRFAVTIVDA